MSRKPERIHVPTSRGPVPGPLPTTPPVRVDHRSLRVTCMEFAIRMGADRPAASVIEDAASIERYILAGLAADPADPAAGTASGRADPDAVA